LYYKTPFGVFLATKTKMQTEIVNPKKRVISAEAKAKAAEKRAAKKAAAQFREGLFDFLLAAAIVLASLTSGYSTLDCSSTLNSLSALRFGVFSQ